MENTLNNLFDDLLNVQVHHPIVMDSDATKVPFKPELISVIKGINIMSIEPGSYEAVAWWLIFLAFCLLPVGLLILVVFDTIPFFWVILWVLLMLGSDLVIGSFFQTFGTILSDEIRWIFFLWFTFFIRLIKRYIFLIDPQEDDIPDTK